MVTMVTVVPTITNVTITSLVTLVTEVSKVTKVISLHWLQQPIKQTRQRSLCNRRFLSFTVLSLR
jgi:hypothetical protein